MHLGGGDYVTKCVAIVTGVSVRPGQRLEEEETLALSHDTKQTLGVKSSALRLLWEGQDMGPSDLGITGGAV